MPNPNYAYAVDENGNPYPVVYGTDQYGNPTIITEDNQAPWYANLLSQGLNVAGSFGNRGGNYNSYPSQYSQAPNGYQPQGATASVTANSSGLGGGFKLDTTTIILLGALAFFLLKGK